ncbi:MAG: DUF1552 domain-containing protein [Planctomycetota bacterium]|nr:MAG: DUF1552 domain-containing protein [Planctomycetota bacterium]
MTLYTRRRMLRDLGISSAVLPFALNLPSLARGAETAAGGGRKQRLVIMFSPNGTVPDAFWPDETGENFTLKPILEPLKPFKDRMLVLHGISDRIRGDGDSHMRGMSCLLTGIELFPGNIQGGSHTPAGWPKGKSIDQEIKRFLQSRPETQTRFGSLEFGVLVPERADPWTRMVYAGPNKPVAPIDSPYQMFEKLYGSVKDREDLKSILDALREDLRRLRQHVGVQDRALLEEHEAFVRDMERELQERREQLLVPAPKLKPGIRDANDNMPIISRMQIDLLVNALANDMARVATLQFTNSVGQARMKWVGVNDGHHGLSHKPDSDKPSQEKLIRINRWFCEQLAYLVGKLASTPEPGGDGSLLDHTTVVWTNELGKGNSHTLDNIPFVLVGNGLGFRMGRALKFNRVPHNRLLLAFAHAMGHELKTFGNPDYCADGPLTGLT